MGCRRRIRARDGRDIGHAVHDKDITHETCPPEKKEETRRREARDWHAKLDAVSLLFVALLFTVSLSFGKTAVT